MTDPGWRRPELCDSAQCPEWQWQDGRLHLRDCAKPGHVLVLSPEDSTYLLAAVKRGELDPERCGT